MKDTAAINTDYDRQAELKSFDDTKAGVKGLVDKGVTKIPRIFITQPDTLAKKQIPDDAHLGIPVIDLDGIAGDVNQRSHVIEEILHAAETWGFFQLLNHGIPMNVMDEMIEGVRRFNEQPNDVKSQYYSRDLADKFVYNCNFDLYQSAAANWRDTIFAVMAPDSVDPNDLPVACRYIHSNIV